MDSKTTILCDVAGLVLLWDYPAFLGELAKRGVEVPSPESDFTFDLYMKGLKNSSWEL